MKDIVKIISLLIITILFSACSDPDQDDVNFEIEPDATESINDINADNYVNELNQKELLQGNSLYYTREDGASIEVFVFMDDSNKVVKTEERYTTHEGGSICTNLFYYKGDHKYVTKEFFEEGDGPNAVFVERVTYYDEKGKPRVTKYRKAPFEDQLENAIYKITEKTDCSDERAVQVLNQTGPYVTNFQFFVQDEHLLYLIVGENKENGYRSSLIVQQKGSIIRQLLADEKGNVGKPLKVEFEKVRGDMGFEFQALLGIGIAD